MEHWNNITLHLRSESVAIDLDTLNAVMLREAFVDDQEVAVQKIRDREVLLQDLVEKLKRFTLRGCRAEACVP